MGIKASQKVKFALIQEALRRSDNLLNVNTESANIHALFPPADFYVMMNFPFYVFLAFCVFLLINSLVCPFYFTRFIFFISRVILFKFTVNPNLRNNSTRKVRLPGITPFLAMTTCRIFSHISLVAASFFACLPSLSSCRPRQA